MDLTHSVIVFPVRAGKVALAQRQQGMRMAGQYVTPGGSIDPEDDSIPVAALRELKEETALEVPESRLVYLGHLTTKGDDWQPIGGHFFMLRLAEDEELKQTEPDAQGPWEWYGYREAAALPLAPVTRSLVHLLAHAAEGG